MISGAVDSGHFGGTNIVELFNQLIDRTNYTYTFLQGLDNDHGQTDSRARAQRLSRAHQKVTWSMLIGVTNFHHQTKQCLPVST